MVNILTAAVGLFGLFRYDIDFHFVFLSFDLTKRKIFVQNIKGGFNEQQRIDHLNLSIC